MPKKVVVDQQSVMSVDSDFEIYDFASGEV